MKIISCLLIINYKDRHNPSTYCFCLILKGGDLFIVSHTHTHTQREWIDKNFSENVYLDA